MKHLTNTFSAVSSIGENYPFFSEGLKALFMSAILVIAIKMVVQIAQGLASVSLDSGAGAAAAGVMGSTGAAVGMAGKAGKAVGGLGVKSLGAGFASKAAGGSFLAGASGFNRLKKFLGKGGNQ